MHGAALSGGIYALLGVASALAASGTGGSAWAGTYESVAVGQTVPSNAEDFCSLAGAFHLYADRKPPAITSTSELFVSARRVDEGFMAVIHPRATTASNSDAMWLVSKFLMGMKACVGASTLRPMRGTTVEGLSIKSDASGNVSVEFLGNPPPN